jgi:hypothetical protein
MVKQSKTLLVTGWYALLIDSRLELQQLVTSNKKIRPLNTIAC